MVAGLLTVAVIGAYMYLRRSLPTIDGTITVPGISAPVDIIRDADAIPHIFAATKADALFGLGYVHAQDRLWQMEFQRRIGYGRLSEIFGAAALPQDRFLRTVGFGRAAQSAWDTAARTRRRQQVEAYVRRRERVPRHASRHRAAAGVHAAALRAGAVDRARRHRVGEDDGLGSERQLLARAAAPRPRSHGRPGTDGAADAAVSRRRASSIVAGARRASADGSHTSGGLATQLDRTATDRTLPSDQAHCDWSAALRHRRCRAAFPRSRDLLLGGATHRGARLEQLGRRRHADRQRQAAARQRSASRHAHAVDSGTSRTCRRGDFDVIGATLPGAPAVALGRNRFIAWGATNVAADVEDLYRERLDATGTLAEFRGAHGADARSIPETIAVKGARSGRSSTCASRATVRSSRTRSTPTTRAVDAPMPKAAAARAARVPMDGARRRRHDARRVPEAERGAQLERVHRGAARLRRRRRRTSSTPTSTATSATTRPAAFRSARAATARGRPKAGPARRNGPAGFRSTSCRTSIRSAATLHRHRQQSAGAAGLSVSRSALEWPEPYRAQRITDLLQRQRRS